MHKILFTALRKAELIEAPDPDQPLKAKGVRGRTVVSLTSPGTELNAGYLGKNFPAETGYACVYEVEETGTEVTDLPAGTLVLGSGNHRSIQEHSRESVLPLPAGLKPEAAVFARLLGVSMSTLNTTTARPPSRVLITGLGPVGNLAAQLFSSCGYRVTAVDPVKVRRDTAASAGLKDVRATLAGGEDIAGQVVLHVECSGHEKAVLDGCRTVRKRGEVVLLGVPWQRKTDIYAFELLHAVFHKYVVLRSGWEWEVPVQPRDFAGNSIIENYAAGMEWIASGRIQTGSLGATYAPARAQEVYNGLLEQTLPCPAAIFDWRTAPLA